MTLDHDAAESIPNVDRNLSPERRPSELTGPSASLPGDTGESAELQREQRRREIRLPGAHPVFFHAESRPDGTYSVTLTEDGLRVFETALGVAQDLGGQTRISTYSTIADIMERTATREELSAVMREESGGFVHGARLLVLRCMLWGSEEPSMPARILGHLGKMLVVALFLLWTLQQFGIAIADIGAIPGILAGIPSDILHLHPTSAVTDVGNKIHDAGLHVVYGVLGVCLTLIAAKLVGPLGRIYRNDQIIAGERAVIRLIARALRRAARRGTPSPPERRV